MDKTPLLERRILVVEDEGIIAIAMRDVLAGAGATVVGPAASLKTATGLATTSSLCSAILDIDLHHEKVWPVASILEARRIPFVFCSGRFSTGDMPGAWATRPLLSKPVRAYNMIDALAGMQADCELSCASTRMCPSWCGGCATS